MKLQNNGPEVIEMEPEEECKEMEGVARVRVKVLEMLLDALANRSLYVTLDESTNCGAYIFEPTIIEAIKFATEKAIEEYKNVDV